MILCGSNRFVLQSPNITIRDHRSNSMIILHVLCNFNLNKAVNVDPKLYKTIRTKQVKTKTFDNHKTLAVHIWLIVNCQSNGLKSQIFGWLKP